MAVCQEAKEGSDVGMGQGSMGMYITRERNMETIAQRVEAGARLLDQENPGWHNKIVVEKIKILSCTKCILGQLYTQFRHGIEKLKIKGVSGDHGFNCSHRDVEKVEEAWCNEIAARVLLDEIASVSQLQAMSEDELSIA